jgi:hypothetical protein
MLVSRTKVSLSTRRKMCVFRPWQAVGNKAKERQIKTTNKDLINGGFEIRTKRRRKPEKWCIIIIFRIIAA